MQAARHARAALLTGALWGRRVCQRCLPLASQGGIDADAKARVQRDVEHLTEGMGARGHGCIAVRRTQPGGARLPASAACCRPARAGALPSSRLPRTARGACAPVLAHPLARPPTRSPRHPRPPAPAAIESAMEWAEQGGEMAAGKLAFELGELEDCMRGAAASDAQ